MLGHSQTAPMQGKGWGGGVGDADDWALLFESGILKFLLFIRIIYLSHCVLFTMSECTLMAEGWEMPIGCQYMFCLSFLCILFFIKSLSSTLFGYICWFSAGGAQVKKLNLCCSIESSCRLMRSGGYWAPGVYSINLKFVPALVQ